MMREERWNEPVSLEAPKIVVIQRRTGSQYRMEERAFCTAHENKVWHSGATFIVFQFANGQCLWQKRQPLCTLNDIWRLY